MDSCIRYATRLIPNDFSNSGNSFNDSERVVASGYDNGDVSLFDLRAGKLLRTVSLKNGVCSLSFDRSDIPMNKLVTGGLEGAVEVLDLRTLDCTSVAQVSTKCSTGTVWCVKPLPQNRDIFMACAGGGDLELFN